MTITLVNSTSSKANTASLAITVPTGGGAGDLLLFGVSNAWPDDWSTPSGLTKGPETRNACDCALYYRIVQGGDPSSYTFTRPSSATTCTAVCVRYSGVDPSTPVRWWSSTQSQALANVTSVTLPLLANVGSTDMSVGFAAAISASNNVTTLLTAPAGWTLRQRLTQNTAAVKSCASIVFDKVAATDTPAATGFSGRYVAYNVCLTDAAAPILTPPRTPPAFRNSSTIGAAAYGTSIVVNVPSGVVDGDLLIAVAVSTQSNVWSMTGWNAMDLATAATNGAGIIDNSTQLWWRIANSEPASYTISLNGSEKLCATILAYAGTDPNIPIRMIQHVETVAISTTSPAPPALGAQSVGDLVLDVYTTGTDTTSSSSTVITPPASGWTTRVNVSSTGASQFQSAIAVVEKQDAADYPTATTTLTGTWAAHSLALTGLAVYPPRRCGPNYRR